MRFNIKQFTKYIPIGYYRVTTDINSIDQYQLMINKSSVDDFIKLTDSYLNLECYHKNLTYSSTGLKEYEVLDNDNKKHGTILIYYKEFRLWKILKHLLKL